MKTGLIAMQEIRVGLRNRWVLATTLLLAALALSLLLNLLLVAWLLFLPR